MKVEIVNCVMPVHTEEGLEWYTSEFDLSRLGNLVAYENLTEEEMWQLYREAMEIEPVYCDWIDVSYVPRKDNNQISWELQISPLFRD